MILKITYASTILKRIVKESKSAETFAQIYNID
jgi:hypothetical protein